MEVIYKEMRFDTVDELIKFANSHVYEYDLISHSFDIDFIGVSAIFKKHNNRYNCYNKEFAKYPTCEQIEEYDNFINYN